MYAISNKNFKDLQAVLAWTAQLRDNVSVKNANTIRKAGVLLRAFSKARPMAGGKEQRNG